MTTTKRTHTPAQTAPAAGTAEVAIRPDRLVYHNGQQVTGTLTNIDPDLALHWLNNHWAIYVWIG